MKTIHFRLGLLFALLFLSVHTVKAHPYASGVTNNNGTVQFILNEGGGTVIVTFEDASTLNLGTLAKGSWSFSLTQGLTIHSSYSIAVAKLGTGTPAQFTTDSDPNATWTSPRGIDININPKNGSLFGRTYTAQNVATTGGALFPARGAGLFAMNADLTDSPLGIGTNGVHAATYAGGVADGFAATAPWNLRVNQTDNTVWVTDATGNHSQVWIYDADLITEAPFFSIQGTAASVPAKQHGDLNGATYATGSIAQSNLVVWTGDAELGCPAATVHGPNTSDNSVNCLYRYTVGKGPLPWSASPDYGVTVGLDSIPQLRPGVDIAPNGNLIGSFLRANNSGSGVQVWDPTGGTLLYFSLQNQAANGGLDIFNGNRSQNGAQAGCFQARVSPDGKYICALDLNGGMTLAILTNGLPDESSIFTVSQANYGGNARGLTWDAADNVWMISSGVANIRGFSLGLTTTAVTANDITGTNGTFQLVAPQINASVVAVTNLASQNYINNVVPGVPIPGVFRITLATNNLNAAVVVGFTMTGTAAQPLNYVIGTTTDANGVTFTTNTVTFPVGSYPGGGFWHADVLITPTATPVIGATTTAIMTLKGGANYSTVNPVRDTVFIANTGPQLLTLSAASAQTGTTMNRGIPGDYANFIITRLGDTNGPANSPGNVVPKAYLVTNFTYTGAAATTGTNNFGKTDPTNRVSDYTAGPQNKTLTIAGFPLAESPTNGFPGIWISPGATAFTCIIGNPVLHSNIFQPPTNMTVVVGITGPGTNNTIVQSSAENLPYTANTTTVTLGLIDNAVIPEKYVLWSDTLTNATDSTNWTLTFASTNMNPTHTVLPIVITNYPNFDLTGDAGGNADYTVAFGANVGDDNVPASPVMLANGWSTALKMTVNKDRTYREPCGVNLYPQKLKFSGNYSLRFNMYLSLYAGAVNNPSPSTFPNEYAMFGMNHCGTNCNWKPANPVTVNTGGSGLTNQDGSFAMINAGAQAITPADYDAFTGGTLPNSTAFEPVSNFNTANAGLFKSPPFFSQDLSNTKGGGTPVNQWVDVSMEIRSNTVVDVLVDNVRTMFNSFTNLIWTNGTVMLGYEDSVNDISDPGSAFVYYSNVRAIELTPAITNSSAATTSLVFLGANLPTWSSGGTSPETGNTFTNFWTRSASSALTTGVNVKTTVGTSNLTSTLTLTNVVATNGGFYYPIMADIAGSITGLVQSVTVVTPLTNAFATVGFTNKLQVLFTGGTAPTFQWSKNGTNLPALAYTNGAQTYSSSTLATYGITNGTTADSGTYAVVLSLAGSAGPLTTSNVWVFTTPTTSAVVTPAATTNNWGDTVVFTVTASGSSTPVGYQWKKNGANLSNGATVSGSTSSLLTLLNVNQSAVSNYTAVVTNGLNSLTSTTGSLTVFVPVPTFKSEGITNGNVTLSFTTTNQFDTTNSWTLLSSTLVVGPYTNTPAVFTGSAGSFQVAVPTNGANVFYELKHN